MHSDMKTLYLHIGPFKTGTTALQVFFAKNQATLKAQGVSYLNLGLIDKARKGEITSGNGAFLARSILPDGHHMALPKTRKQETTKLLHALRDVTTNHALLSSEFLADIDYQQFANLRDFVKKAGFRIKVLMFAREQASYLESLYIQRVKRRLVMDGPKDYINAFFRDVEHLHYARFVAKIRDILGHDAVAIRPYPQPDIFATICQMMDISDAGLERPERSVNVSLTPEQVVIMRELNKFTPRQYISDVLVANEAIARTQKNTDKQTVLPPDFTAEIQAHFAEENKMLADEINDGDPLFSLSDAHYVDLDNLKQAISLETISEMYGGLLVSMDKRLAAMEQNLHKLLHR